MALPLVISAGDPGHLGDHEELHEILKNVELADGWQIVRTNEDALGNRGAAGILGSLFFADDQGANGELTFDSGSGWLGLWELIPSAEFSLLVQGTPNANLTKWRVPLAMVGKSVDQLISSTSLGTTTAVSFDDETGIDVANNEGTTLHNPASLPSRFKATRDGFWDFGVYIKWEDSSVGDRRIRILKNGSNVLAQDDRPATAGGANHMTVGSTVVEMEVGDFVEAHVAQDSGGNLKVRNGSFAWFKFVSDE